MNCCKLRIENDRIMFLCKDTCLARGYDFCSGFVKDKGSDCKYNYDFLCSNIDLKLKTIEELITCLGDFADKLRREKDEDGFCKYSSMFTCSNKKIQKIASKELLNSLVKLIHLIK